MACILIVDDDAPIRKMLERRLRRAGHAVDTAENGQLGVEKILAVAFDLVLMDMHMPVLDGRAAVHLLRQTHGYAGLIIAVTASVLETEAAVAAGCDAVLTKPIGEDFEEKLAEFLERRETN